MKKSNAILTGLTLFGFGVFAFIFTAGMALIPPGSGDIKTVSPILGTYTIRTVSFDSAVIDLLFWLILPLPGILLFEGGSFNFRQGLQINKDRMKELPRTIWTRLAIFNGFADFFNSLLFFLLFIALCTLYLTEISRIKLAVSLNILLYAAAIATYILLRKKLSKRLGKVSKKLRKGFPTFILNENGVTLTLFQKVINSNIRLQPVFLGFDELYEVKVLSSVEADNYLKYSVGPDLQLSVKMVSERQQYLKGEIARPSVFRSGSVTGSKVVLFRNNSLFYLITFETDEVECIEEAYSKFKLSALDTI